MPANGARALSAQGEKRALIGNLTMPSPGIRANLAATAGLTDDVVTLTTRAIQERDPFLMMSMGMWPVTEWLRRVLREAGKLDDVRRQIGLPTRAWSTAI